MNEALYTFKILVEVPKIFYVSKFYVLETSLAVQWLRLWAPSAGGMDLIPGLGTKTHQAAGPIHKLFYVVLYFRMKSGDI